MSFLFWVIGFYCHVLCMHRPVKSHSAGQPLGEQNGFARPRMKDYTAEYYRKSANDGIKKRTISAASKGLAAVEKLLMGSRKVGGRQSKTHRLYKKHGNVKTAIEDFQSVEPMIVTNTNAQRKMHSFAYRKNGRSRDIIVGTVGDRRLILVLNGDKASRYNPVLEIRTATEALHDRIVYSTD